MTGAFNVVFIWSLRIAAPLNALLYGIVGLAALAHMVGWLSFGPAPSEAMVFYMAAMSSILMTFVAVTAWSDK